VGVTPFAERLRDVLPASALAERAPLAPLTTFNVGGPADWLVTVATVEELQAVLSAAREAALPVTVLGGGSNVIVPDAGVRGVVLRVRLMDISQPASDRVRAGAGVTINGLVRWTIGRGLAGLEAWAGTPGTVGGAIFGNAHFGGRDISTLVTQALLASRDGILVTAARDALEFAYDTSRLRRTGELLVWAEFAVGPGDREALRRRARESLAYRKQTQPLAQPSAGCVFQNPDPARDRLPAGMPASAGALIDRAGLKGLQVGGAAVSSAHANFIVSDGRATARDIRTLVETVRRTVREKFGVELRDEVVFLGDDTSER
jgi:UDP-N-acetylmuramate dehydrogenase